jgi:hypothetical protein
MKNLTQNLRVLRKTSRKPEAGDIFAFQLVPIPESFFFGRVVATNTKIGGISGVGVVLIYLYRTPSISKTQFPALKIDDMLLPPIGTNTVPWSKGYFELVKTGENRAEDILRRHSFRDSRGWFFDEYGNRHYEPMDPVGDYALSGIGAIDVDISNAFSLPI